MTHAIRRAAAWAARLFRPPAGRHRAPVTAPADAPAEPSVPPPVAPRVPPRWTVDDEPFFADDHVLVRPYVLVAEERARRQHQRLRRALLVCAQLDMAEAM